MTRLSFDPVLDSYPLVVAAALVLLLLLAVGPPRGRRLGRLKRTALLGLRLGVILLVIVALLRPRMIYTETITQSATLAVLIDQSRSMSVPDAGGGKTRWELLQQSIADAEPALAELAEHFEIKAYTFDAESHPIDVRDGEIPLPEEPDGKQSAIGAAVDDVLREEAGKRLLALILLSDGAQRAYAPRDRPPQTAVGLLKPFGAPMHTLAFGRSRGLGEAKDVAVNDLLVNQSVFVKNRLAIGGQIRVDGYLNREIPVKVFFETSPGKMEEVASQTIRATDEGQLLPIQLSYVPNLPGEYKLTLQAVGQPDELVTTNNRLSTFVNVYGGGLSVLYLEGSLRPETTFLRRALDASPDISVLYQRIDARRPETRPGEMAQWFQPGKYDVYVLGDLDSDAFRQRADDATGPPQADDYPMLAALAEAVDHGAGLIMLGGPHSFGPGGYASTPLANVLPVGMDRNERQRFEDRIRTDVHLTGDTPMGLTDPGRLHFALLLAGSREENLALWASLPPLEGANRFDPTKLAPLALVLADNGRGDPLLVAQSYGAGRVMAMAGYSTWLWPMHGFDEAHKRFWRQIILWLARKDQAADSNVWVRSTKRRYAPSEPVEFTFGARSAAGEPLLDAVFTADVVMPDGSRQPLEPVRQDEQMTASLRKTQTPGDYAVEVTATHRGEPLGGGRARFLVFEQDLELDNAAADAASLESLAAMSGGRSLAPEELPALIRQLIEQTETLQLPQESKWTLWSKRRYVWSFFLVLVGLLGTEWYLRKRWGLV